MQRASLQTQRENQTEIALDRSRAQPDLPHEGRTAAGYWGNQAALRRLTQIAPRVQCKLEIGAVDDPLEAEADQVADEAMQASSFSVSVGSQFLHRKCGACEEEDKRLQMKSSSAVAPTAEAPPIVNEALGSHAEPLDASTRAAFQPLFSSDLGDVRVHAGSLAAQSAQAVGALAYTVGQHVVFGRGQYAPHSREGRRLLAHELTHTIQQPEATQGLRRAPNPPQAGTPSGTGAAPPSPKGSSYRVTPQDMENLQVKTTDLMNALDEQTRGEIVVNGTVAVGLVEDDEGYLTLVYTTNKNRDYKGLEQAAAKQGITNWGKAEPRARGRGAVGAPEDAEQLMIETAEGNGFKVHAMAVTRKLCKDCELAVLVEGPEGIPTVRVNVPLPPSAQHIRDRRNQGAARATANKAAADKAAAASQEPGKTPPSAGPVAAPKDEPAPSASVPPKQTASQMETQPANTTPAEPTAPVKPPAPASPAVEPESPAPAAPQQAPPSKPPVNEPQTTEPAPSATLPKGSGKAVAKGFGKAAVMMGVQLALTSAVKESQRRELLETIAKAKRFVLSQVEDLKSRNPNQPVYLRLTIRESSFSQYLPLYGWVPAEDKIDLWEFHVTTQKIDQPELSVEDHSLDLLRPGEITYTTYTEPVDLPASAPSLAAHPELRAILGLASDDAIRAWIGAHDDAVIALIATGEKMRLINRLLDGWVSSADLNAIDKIVKSATPAELSTISAAVSPRIGTLSDIGQRTRLRAILP